MKKAILFKNYLEKAQSLAKQTGATYPILIPDSTYMNGRLIGIEAIPEVSLSIKTVISLVKLTAAVVILKIGKN